MSKKRLAYWSDEKVGWCGATEIFDEAMGMLEKVVREMSGPAAGEQSITDHVDDLIRPEVKRFAEMLRDADWDCTDESEYYDRFTQEIEGWTDDEYYEYLREKLKDHFVAATLEKMMIVGKRLGKVGHDVYVEQEEGGD